MFKVFIEQTREVKNHPHMPLHQESRNEALKEKSCVFDEFTTVSKKPFSQHIVFSSMKKQSLQTRVYEYSEPARAP